MNPDTTPTPTWKVCKTFNSALLEDEKEGERLNEIFCADEDEAECLVALLNNLDQEITQKTNEVARLRAENSQLQKELTKSESERLQIEDINGWIDSEFQIANKRALQAEAEVERLRELLNRAIETIEEEGCPKTANDIREELARPDPSPEETHYHHESYCRKCNEPK